MDDRREDGGVVTGTGTTSVPEVEAVNEVIEGATPDATEVPEMVGSLLTTALSADEAEVADAEDSGVVLSMAVAVLRLLPVADDTKVLFAGTEMRVPGVEVVKTSLVATVLAMVLSVEVAEASLVASDAMDDVVVTLAVRSVGVVLLSVCEGTLSVVAGVVAAISVAFALSVTEAVI